MTSPPGSRRRDAGVRHVILDLVGPVEERSAQLELFAHEVAPLLSCPENRKVRLSDGERWFTIGNRCAMNDVSLEREVRAWWRTFRSTSLR